MFSFDAETQEDDAPNDKPSLLKPLPVVEAAEEEEAKKLSKAYCATLLGLIMGIKRETS